jgi:deoxyribose-phosphate aldolase
MTASLTRSQLAEMIDHAVLAPAAALAELRTGCELAARLKLKSVCVKPCYVADAADLLARTRVEVGTVISFPHGADPSPIKADQARAAVDAGADELDMVINIAALIDGQEGYVRDEIAAVVAAAEGRVVKVILECALLSDPQKRLGCRLSEQAGARFVKTSTGFASGGATVEDVRLMRSAVGAGVEVKASGGVRSYADAVALYNAGATRIGASSSEAMLADAPAD